MFLGIYSWMLANVPGFMRPGVNWLISGIRKVTGVVAALWNALGMAIGVFFGAVFGFRTQLATFATSVVNGIWWLRNVWVPARLDALRNTIVTTFNAVISSVRAEVLSWVQGLERWWAATWADLKATVNGLGRWALDQIAKIGATISALIRGLAHVLSGPEVLAEWLLGSIWRAALRRLYAERDRIFTWLLQGSVSFTVWLGRMIEDMIVRLL